MTTKKIVCALAVPLALAACSGRSAAEKAVRDTLKDPDSAKFGEFYYNSKTGKACLTTNAKNVMGGYTGDKQERLFKDKEGWHEVYGFEDTAERCRSTYADVAEKGDSASSPSERAADEMERMADQMSNAADNLNDAK